MEAIVAGGETATVEFKKSTGQRGKAAQSVCAMLNGKGGSVLFGVSDQGEIHGQEVSSRTIEKLVQELRQIESHTPLDPELVELSGTRGVLVLSVPSGGSPPYTLGGKPFVRIGPTTSVMQQAQYERLLEERMHPTRRWELMPTHELTLEDLDHAEITRTVDEAIRRGRMDEPGTRDPKRLLLGLGLIRSGRPLNAAVALFGLSDRLLPYYTQCVLRLARFRGTTKDVFEDNRQVYGHAFDLLVEAQRFLRQHLPVAGRVVPDLFERIDDPLYPLEALREALANAICHRDYSTGSGAVSVAIFDDRLEISSIGRLPFGQTPADLMRPHSSRPWNPLIASVFFRRGLIETWGRGTLRIVDLAAAAGLPAPEFEERTGAVLVRFRPGAYVAPSRATHDLTPLQRELLEILAAHGPISISSIESLLRNRPARRTVQEHLALLRKIKLVESTGSGRGASWKLKGPVV